MECHTIDGCNIKPRGIAMVEIKGKDVSALLAVVFG
jgi:hypothetical protein